MKLLKLLFLVTPFVFALWACEGSIDDEKRVSNDAAIERFISSNKLTYTKQNFVYHSILTKGYGYQVNRGDSVAFWYIGQTLTGIVFDTNILDVAIKKDLDTSTRNFEPIKVVAGKSNLLEGLKRGLLLCREGQNSMILFPSSLGFEGNAVGPIDPWSPLAYTIFIIYVKNQKIEEEQNFISNFVASSEGFSQDTLGFWVKYLNDSQQEVKPAKGDTIYGWFSSSVLGGAVFEEVSTENKQIVLRENELTEGLLYSFLRMKPGDEIQTVVPSSMGYGINKHNNIEPYTPLFYHVRLDSIK